MEKTKINLEQRALRITRTLQAPVELVWEAWTKPEHIANWWGPNGFTNTIHEMDFCEGGEWKFTMHGPDGTNYANRSVFREIIPLKRIVFEHFNPHFITTVLFEAQGDVTLMDWAVLFDTAEELETVVKAHQADEGLKQNIEKLERYLSQKHHQKMKTDLLFDFKVDKKTQTVHIKREFAASLDLVWNAWTTPEILDRWWAPKPYTSKTKMMDFKVGGRRFYAMVSLEGQEHWSIQKYTSISPKTNFRMFNAFADKDENPELPGSDWDLNFSEQNGTTTVNISIKNDSLARMEKMIEMGFKEGFTMTLDSLDTLLQHLKK